MGEDPLWEELGDWEQFDLVTSGARPVSEVVESHPWLKVTKQIAAEQNFFHWELDFASVFERGGFDLQVGNPPWVRPRTDINALYSESDPWFSLEHKPTQAAINARRETLFSQNPAAVAPVFRGIADSVVTSAVLGSVELLPTFGESTT